MKMCLLILGQLEGKTVVVAGNLTDKQSSLTLPFDIDENAIKLHNYNSQLDQNHLSHSKHL